MEREVELVLVERLRGGDPAAFDVIYEEFRPRLFTFLARLSCRRQLAEDLLEETWLRLVTNAHRLRCDTRLGPWLFTVARNLYISYCRSRLVDQTCMSDLIGIWPTAGSQPSPFEMAAASELERRVEVALAVLPPRYREVLLLVVVEGFTPAEAATVCDVSPVALRQRLSRGRAMLARELAVTAGSDAPLLKGVVA